MARGIPIPVPFLIAVVLVVALLIFFGAWAVSADAERLDRTLSFGLSGGAYPGPGSARLERPSPSLAPADTGAGGSAVDTWWGRSLIAACPLH